MEADIEEYKLRGERTGNNYEIEKLKQKLLEKAEIIENERSNIEALKKSFADRMKEREYLEAQLLKNTTLLPEGTSKKITDTNQFKMMQEYRMQIKKLRATLDKYKEKSAEDEKLIKELTEDKAVKQNETKAMLNNQLKDQEIIKKLRQKRDMLEEKIKEIEAEREKEREKERKPSFKKALKQTLYLERMKGLFIEGDSKFKKLPQESKPKMTEDKEIEEIQESPSKLVVRESGLDYMRQLIKICLQKNIDLQRHLQRYDINKLNKISEREFLRAIDELKLGFIDKEIEDLASLFKDVENFVAIAEFLKKAIEIEPEYQNIIMDQGRLLIRTQNRTDGEKQDEEIRPADETELQSKLLKSYRCL